MIVKNSQDKMSNYSYRVADEIIEELKTRYGFSDWWYKISTETRVSIVERMVDIMEYYGVIKYVSSEDENNSNSSD